LRTFIDLSMGSVVSSAAGSEAELQPEAYAIFNLSA